MQLTKSMMGNLINRYRAVLKNCTLINLFGSLIFATMFLAGSAGMAKAMEGDIVTDTVNLDTIEPNILYIYNSAIYTNMASGKVTVSEYAILGMGSDSPGYFTNFGNVDVSVSGLGVYAGTYTNKDGGNTNISAPAEVDTPGALDIIGGTYNNEGGKTTVNGYTIIGGEDYDDSGNSTGKALAGTFTNSAIAELNDDLNIIHGSYNNTGGTTTITGMTTIGATVLDNDENIIYVGEGTFTNAATANLKGGLAIKNGEYDNSGTTTITKKTIIGTPDTQGTFTNSGTAEFNDTLSIMKNSSYTNTNGTTTVAGMTSLAGGDSAKFDNYATVDFKSSLSVLLGTYTNFSDTTTIDSHSKFGYALRFLNGTYNNEGGTTIVNGDTHIGLISNKSGTFINSAIAKLNGDLLISSGSYSNIGGTTTIAELTTVGTNILGKDGSILWTGAGTFTNAATANLNSLDIKYGTYSNTGGTTTITGLTNIGSLVDKSGATHTGEFINSGGTTSFQDLDLSAAGAKLIISEGDVDIQKLSMAAGTTVSVGGDASAVATLTFTDLANEGTREHSIKINAGGTIEIDKGVVFQDVVGGEYAIQDEVRIDSFTVNVGGMLKITGYNTDELSSEDLIALKDLLGFEADEGLIDIGSDSSGGDEGNGAGHVDYTKIEDRDFTNTLHQKSIADVSADEATTNGLKGAFAGLKLEELTSETDAVKVHETLILTGNKVTGEDGIARNEHLVTNKAGDKNIADFNVNDGALIVGNREQNNSGEIGNVNLGATDGNFSAIGKGGDASETSFTTGDIMENGSVIIAGTNMITGAIGAANNSDNINISINNGSLSTVKADVVSDITIGTGSIIAIDSNITVGNVSIASGNITVENSEGNNYKSSIKELNLGIAGDNTQSVKAIFAGEASFTNGASVHVASSLEIDTLAQTTDTNFAALGQNSYIRVGEVIGDNVSTFIVGKAGGASIAGEYSIESEASITGGTAGIESEAGAGEYGILSFGTMSRDIIQDHADNLDFNPTRVVAVNKPVDLSKVIIHASPVVADSINDANVEIGAGTLLIAGGDGSPIFVTDAADSVEKTVNLADGSGLLMTVDNGLKPGIYILTGDNVEASVGDLAYAGTDNSMLTLGIDGVQANADGQLVVTVIGKNAAEIAREHPDLDNEVIDLIAAMIDKEGINYNAAEGGHRFLSRWTSLPSGGAGKSADQSLQSAVDVTFASAAPQIAQNISNSTAAISTARTSFVIPAVAGGESTSVAMNDDSVELSGFSASQNMQNGIGLWFMPMYQNQQAYGYNSGGLDTGYNSYLFGAVLGADFTMNNAFRIGASLSIGGGQAKSTGDLNDTTNDFNYYGFGLYAGYQFNNFGLTADVGYSNNNSEVNQEQPIALGGNFEADIYSRTFTAGLRGEYKFTSEFIDIIPHLAVRMTNIQMDSYSMSNGFGTVMKLGSTSSTIWTFPVGLTFSKDIKTSGGWIIQPQLDLSITPAAGDLEAKQNIHFTGVSGSITSKADIMDYLSYGGGLGLNLMKDDLSISLNYNMQTSEHMTNHGMQLTFRFEF